MPCTIDAYFDTATFDNSCFDTLAVVAVYVAGQTPMTRDVAEEPYLLIER